MKKLIILSILFLSCLTVEAARKFDLQAFESYVGKKGLFKKDGSFRVAESKEGLAEQYDKSISLFSENKKGRLPWMVRGASDAYVMGLGNFLHVKPADLSYQQRQVEQIMSATVVAAKRAGYRFQSSSQNSQNPQ